MTQVTLANQFYPFMLTHNTQYWLNPTLGDIYDLMISDLTRAVTYLGGWNRGDKSQIDQWVARGLLAYAYGAKGDFAQMGTVAAEVVDANVFTIMPNSQIVFQGDNTQGGFNNINAASGAMWGVDLTADQNIGLVSFWGKWIFSPTATSGQGISRPWMTHFIAKFPTMMYEEISLEVMVG